jgi:hypothetical protein
VRQLKSSASRIAANGLITGGRLRQTGEPTFPGMLRAG